MKKAISLTICFTLYFNLYADFGDCVTFKATFSFKKGREITGYVQYRGDDIPGKYLSEGETRTISNANLYQTIISNAQSIHYGDHIRKGEFVIYKQIHNPEYFHAPGKRQIKYQAVAYSEYLIFGSDSLLNSTFIGGYGCKGDWLNSEIVKAPKSVVEKLNFEKFLNSTTYSPYNIHENPWDGYVALNYNDSISVDSLRLLVKRNINTLYFQLFVQNIRKEDIASFEWNYEKFREQMDDYLAKYHALRRQLYKSQVILVHTWEVI